MAIRQLFLSMRTVLPIAAVLGGMTVAATPAAASTASGPNCGPKSVTPFQAPGMNKTENFTVGDGGTVTLLQKSNTKLKVTGLDPEKGDMDGGTYVRIHGRAGRAAVLADRAPPTTTRPARAPVRHQPLTRSTSSRTRTVPRSGRPSSLSASNRRSPRSAGPDRQPAISLNH